MKQLKTYLGFFFIVAGIIMMAGSAGDCDGACMENANTLGEMIAIICMGFFLMAAGGFAFAKA